MAIDPRAMNCCNLKFGAYKTKIIGSSLDLVVRHGTRMDSLVKYEAEFADLVNYQLFPLCFT